MMYPTVVTIKASSIVHVDAKETQGRPRRLSIYDHLFGSEVNLKPCETVLDAGYGPQARGAGGTAGCSVQATGFITEMTCH